MLSFKFLGWFQWSLLSMCLLSSVGTTKSEAQMLWQWGRIEKVFKASSDRQREQIVTFKYYSEITFKKGKAGIWFRKYSGNKQFLANHLLHWFIFLFCLQTVLQQTSNFTVLFSWVILQMLNKENLHLVDCLLIVFSICLYV